MNDSCRASFRPFPLALLLPLLFLPADAACAQVTAVQARPDSTLEWAAQAKAGFQAQVGDTVTERNSLPYDRVGLIAQRLLGRLPGRDLLRAREIQPALDSLGLETEVAVDAGSPGFALVLVRNPWRRASQAVGYLCWYRASDLRVQGTVFGGGHLPDMRVWWSGRPDMPYEWGVVDQTRPGLLRFTLLGLHPDGLGWQIRHSEEDHPLLSEPGVTAWTDINRDGLPELVSWTNTPGDSLFTECADCPKLVTERTFAEGPLGFERMDERLLPTPYSTLVYFVRMLIDGRTTQAGRLLRDPARVKEAIAEGWNRRVVHAPWLVERGEPGQPWPRRLGLRFQGPNGIRRYDFVFAMKDDHWIIEDWFVPHTQQRSYPSVIVPPSGSAPKPAPAKKSTPAPAKKPATTGTPK
jgi:hypothetical protein